MIIDAYLTATELRMKGFLIRITVFYFCCDTHNYKIDEDKYIIVYYYDAVDYCHPSSRELCMVVVGLDSSRIRVTFRRSSELLI